MQLGTELTGSLLLRSAIYVRLFVSDTVLQASLLTSIYVTLVKDGGANVELDEFFEQVNTVASLLKEAHTEQMIVGDMPLDDIVKLSYEKVTGEPFEDDKKAN